MYDIIDYYIIDRLRKKKKYRNNSHIKFHKYKLLVNWIFIVIGLTIFFKYIGAFKKSESINDISSIYQYQPVQSVQPKQSIQVKQPILPYRQQMYKHPLDEILENIEKLPVKDEFSLTGYENALL